MSPIYAEAPPEVAKRKFPPPTQTNYTAVTPILHIILYYSNSKKSTLEIGGGYSFYFFTWSIIIYIRARIK